MRIQDLGRSTYTASWEAQRAALEAVLAGGPDTLILVEHEPVYTLGRRREAAANVLDPRGVPVIEVERGGDVTFHGPGQLTAYPIVKLPEGRRDLHAHLRALEEAAILTCADFGLRAERDARNSGAWVGGRKICAVGIACRKWVTWHGLALNISTDLDYFRRINPCGMDSALVTTMARELGADPGFEVVKSRLVLHLQALLG